MPLTEWPARAREAAIALSGGAVEEEPVGVQLLSDIRELFEKSGAEEMRTVDILDHLAELSERPWPEWSHGKPITARGLANILKPFGIRPVTFRKNGEIPKGYRKADFADTFGRYLNVAESIRNIRNICSKPLTNQGKMSVADTQKVSEFVADKFGVNFKKTNNVADVADSKMEMAAGHDLAEFEQDSLTENMVYPDGAFTTKIGRGERGQPVDFVEGYEPAFDAPDGGGN